MIQNNNFTTHTPRAQNRFLYRVHMEHFHWKFYRWVMTPWLTDVCHICRKRLFYWCVWNIHHFSIILLTIMTFATKRTKTNIISRILFTYLIVWISEIKKHMLVTLRPWPVNIRIVSMGLYNYSEVSNCNQNNKWMILMFHSFHFGTRFHAFIVLTIFQLRFASILLCVTWSIFYYQ